MVTQLELIPTLTHCIETSARQEFLKSSNEYMQIDKKDKRLEAKIELLRMFLETVDFRKLRAESEKHLVEGKRVRFILYLEKGKPKYELEIGPYCPT